MAKRIAEPPKARSANKHFAPPRGPFADESAKDNLGDLASRALLARPGISLRVRLIMGFSIIFIVALAVVIATWVIIARLDDKLEFVERADKFANEIQQCRRYEKNYFLYGTGHAQLLKHLAAARQTLFEAKVELSRVIGAARFQKLEAHLEAYTRIVYRLLELRRGLHSPKAAPKAAPKVASKAAPETKIESELREHGARLVSTALIMSRQERTDVRRNLHIMRQSTLVTLAVFLIIMIITANFMARHLLTRLRHLNGVVKRVGEGDFSPIMPLRKYKDEFTSLAVTLNHMMEELVTRQEQLIQTRKIAAVGTLTAGIAHEINNPVNNISLVLESLSDPKSVIDEAERQRLLREAMNQTDRVADIVKNLLEFSRSNHPRLKDVSLEELIDVTVSLVSNEMKLREVRFSKQVTDSIPPLYADKGGLQQVFLNMFLNGIQAMPEGGEMTVLLGLTEARDEVKIEIRDTGVGIAPEHLADIFDPFFTTKTETEGTGLGLSVSYSIIDKHGGRIEVESAVGQGTAFIIYLPVDSAEH